MSETIPELDPKRLPRHVALIMDGNGRWAKKRGVSRVKGHQAGAESARTVIRACRRLEGIESLTLYAFSTENWRRSKMEVNALFRLLSKQIQLKIGELHEEGVRVVYMGRREELNQKVLADMSASEALTRQNKEMLLNVAVNYGARTELVDACQAICRKVKSGALRQKDIDEACLADHLYVPETQNVDLLVRTGGEMRLSNFMLWQLSYAEIVVTPALWPTFGKRHLYQAIAEYQARNRRFGGRK